MTFNVDYEHIYFDRYDVDKKKEANFILKEVFGAETEINEDEIKINDSCDIDAIIDLLKSEFFILLTPCREFVEEVSCETLAVDYVKNNFTKESLTVEEICDYCNATRSVIDRRFVTLFGKTVAEYVRLCRIEKAEQLLMQGKNVGEVALLSGFGSVKSLTRAFKSILGKTPGEYRASFLDTEERK